MTASHTSRIPGAYGLALTLLLSATTWSQETRVDASATETQLTSVAALRDQLRSGEWNQQSSALERLGQHRTPEARVVLRRAALGEYGKGITDVASTWLFKSLDDKAQAREFLPWDTLAGSALVKMRGIAVDTALWEYARPRLESTDLELRFRCVELLQEDPAGFDPAAKVSALLASLASAAKLPAAKERSGFDGIEISGRTELDDYFSAVTRALAFAPGITVDILREQTPAEDGLAREAAIIARRWRGDQEVAPEFRRVMEHGMFPGSRIQAVLASNSLCGPGSLDPADLEVLRRVAVGDTNSFIPGQRYRGHKPEPRFQVREAATWVLDELALREKLEKQVTPQP